MLLVRHGTTPTTGQVLPGRARGLHLADAGRAQAEVVAARVSQWAAASRADPTPASPRTAPPPAGPRGRSAGTSAPVGPGRGRRARREAAASPSSHPSGRAGGIAAVYASPMERARETAAPIARTLSLPVKVTRGLTECDFGDWTGAALKDLAKLPEWTTVQRYPSGFRFPGGESFSAMQARMVDTITAIGDRHRGEVVVAVSHADPIKAVVADALGTPLDLFQRIVISPCSVTAISYGVTGPTVLAVNSTSSLSELQPS